MKNIVFASVAALGISLSLVYANDLSFLDNVEKRLFTDDILTPMEKARLLSLSSESPAKKVKAEATLTKRARRDYSHINLTPRKPFYQKRVQRVLGDPSIEIVKQKDKISREKALRYRSLFSR